MAKKFGGFTPQQQQTLLSKMGYTGPAQQDDINKFMMSSPKAASMMGKYAQMAKARVEGGPQMAMQVGGLSAEEQMEKFNQAQQTASSLNNTMSGNYTKPTEDFGKPLQATATPSAAGNIEAFNQQQQQAMDQMNSNPDQFAQIKQQQEEFQNSPVMVAAREAQEKIQQQAFQQAGLSGPPTNQQEADRVNEIFNTLAANSPEIQAAQTAQQNFMSTMPGYDTKPVEQPIAKPGQPTLYSGDITNQTMEDIMKMASGATPVDLQYDFNRDGKITSDDALQAGKVGVLRGTVAEGTDSGGVYDPSQGLPETIGTLYTDPDEAMNAAFESDFNEGTTGTNQNLGGDKTWAKANASTLANVENPKDYTLRLDGKYWTLVYPDGTEIQTGHKNKNYATGRGNILAAAAEANKNVVTPEEKTQKEEEYQRKVSAYQEYQAGEAQAQADKPAADVVKESQAQVTVSENLIANYQKELADLDADDPRRAQLEEFISSEQLKLNKATADLTQAKGRQSAEQAQASKESVAAFEADPAGQVTKADVATVSEADRQAGMIDSTVGQAGEVTPATAAEVTAAGDVALPEVKEAATYDAITASPEVQSTLDTLEAATGKPSAEALAEAQTMNPEELAQLGLSAAQIEEAVQVQAPAKRTVQEGELLGEEDVTVDMERVEKEALNFEAATGTPSTDATVQGQLTNLMEDFEGGETPPWAAGAMRAATQRMAARGLSASSMAGQAIVQAAMESAMPIAMADAQTVASFEAQNLSNRQAAAMLKAEQRAKFLGMEFDQGFQIRVQNAAKIADIANQNFTAEVQIALENARLANTVDLANLDAKNAKILSDAAAMSNMELANLDRRQQAAVQQANAFLNFDMKEFDAKQEVAMFKTQAQINSLLTDTAAENAAAQFNATSENQTNQFYDSLTSQVQQFNVDQKNAMERFEADQANQMAKFNSEMDARREEFNAANALIVAQANAKWDQESN
jgi:hypothetical protein